MGAMGQLTLRMEALQQRGEQVGIMSSTSQVLPTCVSQLCKRGECMSAFYPSLPFHCNCRNHYLCHSRLHYSHHLISQLRGGRGETRLSRNFPATSLSSPASSPSISPTSPGAACNHLNETIPVHYFYRHGCHGIGRGHTAL